MSHVVRKICSCTYQYRFENPCPVDEVEGFAGKSYAGESFSGNCLGCTLQEPMIHVTTSSVGEDDAAFIAVQWSVDTSFNLLIIVYYLGCEIESHINLIYLVPNSKNKMDRGRAVALVILK